MYRNGCPAFTAADSSALGGSSSKGRPVPSPYSYIAGVIIRTKDNQTIL